FAKNGNAKINFNYFNHTLIEARSIAIQGNKIIVAGYTTDINHYDHFALSRYTGNGTLDASFGENGLVTTDFNFYAHANSLAIQGNKIIAAGYTYTSNDDIALARYTTDGSLDSSFGVNGKLSSYFPLSQ